MILLIHFCIWSLVKSRFQFFIVLALELYLHILGCVVLIVKLLRKACAPVTQLRVYFREDKETIFLDFLLERERGVFEQEDDRGMETYIEMTWTKHGTDDSKLFSQP